nr:hypothetical protein [Tanacetum cinerariifolium]
MRDSIFKGPYKRKDIPDPNNELETIPKPISKMSKPNKEQYFADIRMMNYILQRIPNDIYNSIDACPYAKQMCARIKRLMQGSDISKQERHSRLMNEFFKFVAMKGESLTSLYKRSITQRYSTPTNNRLRTPSNTRNQAVILDGHVDIQSKNVGYAGNGNRNVGRQNRNQATNEGNGEKMLLITKDEAGVHLDEEENDFMLDNAYRDNTLKEVNAIVIMMARIQPNDDKSNAKPAYAEFISNVNASQVDMINELVSKSDHEQHHQEN